MNRSFDHFVAARAVTVGDGMTPGFTMGPLATVRHYGWAVDPASRHNGSALEQRSARPILKMISWPAVDPRSQEPKG